jgi:hypothetical protein
MKTQRYQLLVLGTVDSGWSGYFDGATITASNTGVTKLVGEVADQAALHGMLTRIRDLNLKVVSVHLLDDDGVTPVECRHCERRPQ